VIVMPRIPPRKPKGPHNPEDDKYLVQLWKALRLERPDLTKEEFARIAKPNYYQKNAKPGEPPNISTRSIVRHLNRLLARRGKK
jgi:hypothetical protein